MFSLIAFFLISSIFVSIARIFKKNVSRTLIGLLLVLQVIFLLIFLPLINIFSSYFNFYYYYESFHTLTIIAIIFSIIAMIVKVDYSKNNHFSKLGNLIMVANILAITSILLMYQNTKINYNTYTDYITTEKNNNKTIFYTLTDDNDETSEIELFISDFKDKQLKITNKDGRQLNTIEDIKPNEVISFNLSDNAKFVSFNFNDSLEAIYYNLYYEENGKLTKLSPTKENRYTQNNYLNFEFYSDNKNKTYYLIKSFQYKLPLDTVNKNNAKI